MRARNIKPGFYANDRLAECSFPARLLFPGLWMLADREGRLENRPRKIKGLVLPYDSLEVEPLLQELEDAEMIVRYESNGMQVIGILNFKKHQRPHAKEPASILPPIPSTVYEKPGKGTSEPGKGTVEPRTFALNPDILNPSSLNEEYRKPDPKPASSEKSTQASSKDKNQKTEIDPIVDAAQRFVFRQTGAKENEYKVADAIRSMVDFGYSMAEIDSEIDKPSSARNLSEKFFKIQDRLEKAREPPKNGKAPRDPLREKAIAMGWYRPSSGEVFDPEIHNEKNGVRP